MRDKTKTLCYRWFHEVWNQKKEQVIDQLLSHDCFAHGINSEDGPKGIEGFKVFYHDFIKQFQNIQIEVLDVITQDDMECAHTEVTAIHGETGKPVKFSGLCLIKIENGKIAEAWNHYDFLSMYQQLRAKTYVNGNCIGTFHHNLFSNHQLVISLIITGANM